MVFRFDSAQHLQDWEDSRERQTLLAEGEHLVEATDMHRVSGLETWFSLPGRTAPAPPKWKMFLVSATVFYLLNLTLSLIYGWELVSWPLSAAHHAGFRSGDGDRDLAGDAAGGPAVAALALRPAALSLIGLNPAQDGRQGQLPAILTLARRSPVERGR